ncbi:hypothetical protein BGZ68_001696 [Mortierella alpina]|nr:hypothetical protein BGZ68_001696 [Mortierella alpina]
MNRQLRSNRKPLSELDQSHLDCRGAIIQQEQRSIIGPEPAYKRPRADSYDSDKENTTVDETATRSGVTVATESICTQGSNSVIFIPSGGEYAVGTADLQPSILDGSRTRTKHDTKQIVGHQVVGEPWTIGYSTGVSQGSVSNNVPSQGTGFIDKQYEQFKMLQAEAVEFSFRVQEAKEDLEVAQRYYSESKRMVRLRDAEVELAFARFDEAKAKHREFRRRTILLLSAEL